MKKVQPTPPLVLKFLEILNSRFIHENFTMHKHDELKQQGTFIEIKDT